MDKSCFDDLFLKAMNMFSSEIGEHIYSSAQKTIDSYNMFPLINKGVLVGFSGGSDSLMLLLFLLEYKRRNSLNFKICVCHVNHLIRGDEAFFDEEFSASVAKGLNVEFEAVRVDIPKIAKEKKLSIEDAARQERYRIFDDIIQKKRLAAVCVAHNASDNAETIIFNILRGSGINGAIGIKAKRQNIIRPLISVDKDSIRCALNQYKISYVNDSTNDKDDYTRNYIRHTIFPSFEKINPSAVSAFSRFSDNLKADAEYLDNVARVELLNVTKKGYIDKNKLSSLPTAIFVRVFSELASSAGIKMLERRQLLLIKEKLSSDNFSLSVSSGVAFVCQRGKCFFEKENFVRNKEFCQRLNYGVNSVDDLPFDIVVYDSANVDKSFLNVYNFSIQIEAPFDIIKGDLYVRNKKDGDAYRYNGINHKLKKVFNDRNIPPVERSVIPIICDDAGILWVPGLKLREYKSESVDSSKTVKIWLCVKNGNLEEKALFTALPRNKERLG